MENRRKMYPQLGNGDRIGVVIGGSFEVFYFPLVLGKNLCSSSDPRLKERIEVVESCKLS